ncbi:threonine ammonia-lyase [Halobacteriovorax sp. BALOs_7]|uniref:threonine ammonia-lyase n=1 Tax=Halobacteriovorax sp. BALOs_7 TaxID=2109558 RepID=UPI000EB77B39|nr:threonine ammonia-lyase [Halobacteriovorax sp. BALOs_7]AYF45374.1 threonine ammonia-lyase [Halobacteriovorax sp. BALOs_7]
MTDKLIVDLNDIKEARLNIESRIIKTPLTYSTTLSEKFNCEVYLKLENLQLTGAYKVRGALNRLSKLSEEEKEKGVIASSAGNHAQGVALAAKQLGIKATIVMPESTPLAKIQGTKKFGAEVILHGNFYDDAYQKALEIQRENGQVFIHPFNDKDIIAGQGTIGLEILDELSDADIIAVPIGGGGLISGIATAIKESGSKCHVVGVEASEMPAMKQSQEKGHITTIEKKKTIADGIAVTTVLDNTFDIVKKYVDEIVTVKETEISHAIVTLLEYEKILTEGAGAASVASLLYDQLSDIKGKKVVLVVSGGNIDLNILDRIIERGLVTSGRSCSIVVNVPDTPGTIAHIASIIGGKEANILEIHHNRAFTTSVLGETEVEFTLETRGHLHIREIVDELTSKGFSAKRV